MVMAAEPANGSHSVPTFCGKYRRISAARFLLLPWYGIGCGTVFVFMSPFFLYPNASRNRLPKAACEAAQLWAVRVDAIVRALTSSCHFLFELPLPQHFPNALQSTHSALYYHCLRGYSI